MSKKTNLTDSLVIAAVFVAICGIGIFLAVDGMETVPNNSTVPKGVVRKDTIKTIPVEETDSAILAQSEQDRKRIYDSLDKGTKKLIK